MFFVPILAHGALGYWDDLIFLAIIIIFLSMMGISWFRSRTIDLDDTPTDQPDQPNNDERFQLD